jgi:hypothetical protein
MPIPFEQRVAFTQATLLALESLSCGASLTHRDPD